MTGVAALWVVSIAVPVPWKFVVWAVATLIDVAAPIVAGRRPGRAPLHLEHLPDRFGLLVILVLGEVIAGIVTGVHDTKWAGVSVVIGVAGFLVAAAAVVGLLRRRRSSQRPRDPGRRRTGPEGLGGEGRDCVRRSGRRAGHARRTGRRAARPLRLRALAADRRHPRRRRRGRGAGPPPRPVPPVERQLPGQRRRRRLHARGGNAAARRRAALPAVPGVAARRRGGRPDPGAIGSRGPVGLRRGRRGVDHRRGLRRSGHRRITPADAPRTSDGSGSCSWSRTTLPPFSTYSAPGGLRQGPRGGAESPAEAATPRSEPMSDDP